GTVNVNTRHRMYSRLMTTATWRCSTKPLTKASASRLSRRSAVARSAHCRSRTDMGDGIVNDADRLAGNPGARRIPIPGTENLRDVGGYRAADGSEVPRPHLYRAGGLIKPGGPKQYSFYDSEYDEKYRDLGVRTVIDLRAEKEAARAPS